MYSDAIWNDVLELQIFFENNDIIWCILALFETNDGRLLGSMGASGLCISQVRTLKLPRVL